MKRFLFQWFVGAAAVCFSLLGLAYTQARAGTSPDTAAPRLLSHTAAAATGQRRPPMGHMPRGMPMHGRVVRVMGPNQFVVRTPDNREVIVNVNERTQFLMNQRAAHFRDLRARQAVDVLLNPMGRRNLAQSVTLANAERQVEMVRGTIVRRAEAERRDHGHRGPDEVAQELHSP